MRWSLSRPETSPHVTNSPTLVGAPHPFDGAHDRPPPTRRGTFRHPPTSSLTRLSDTSPPTCRGSSPTGRRGHSIIGRDELRVTSRGRTGVYWARDRDGVTAPRRGAAVSVALWPDAIPLPVRAHRPHTTDGWADTLTVLGAHRRVSTCGQTDSPPGRGGAGARRPDGCTDTLPAGAHPRVRPPVGARVDTRETAVGSGYPGSVPV